MKGCFIDAVERALRSAERASILLVVFNHLPSRSSNPQEVMSDRALVIALIWQRPWLEALRSSPEHISH